MDARVHFTDERQCIGIWYNLALVDNAGQMDGPQMQAVGETYKLLARTYSHVAGLCVVRPGAPVATLSARQEAARFAQELGPVLAHVAVVIEAEGVVAQMFRSAMRAFTVFSRTPPISFDGKIEDAARLLAPIVQCPLPSHQVVREMRGAFDVLRAGYKLAPK
jgi:hypothetical protein